MNMLESISEADETTEVDEVVVKLNVRRDLTLKTPLFDITFKELQLGDRVANGNRGLLPMSLYTVVCEKMCQFIGSDTAKIQYKVLTAKEIAAGKIPKLAEMFTQDLTLKPEYTKRLTDNVVNEVENMVTLILAYSKVLGEAMSQREAEFPPKSDRPKDLPQFAWANAAKAALVEGIEPGKITDYKEAIRYWMVSSDVRQRALKQAEKAADREEPEINDNSSVLDVLSSIS